MKNIDRAEPRSQKDGRSLGHEKRRRDRRGIGEVKFEELSPLLTPSIND